MIPIKFVGNLVGQVTDHILDKLWPLEVHMRSYLGMWDHDTVDRDEKQCTYYECHCDDSRVRADDED